MAHEGVAGIADGFGGGGSASGHGGAGGGGRGGYGGGNDAGAGAGERDRRGGFWRGRHPKRYATRNLPSGGGNPRPSRSIQRMLEPLVARDGGFKTKEVCTAAGTTSTVVVRADGFCGQEFGKDLICLNYASGRCPY